MLDLYTLVYIANLICFCVTTILAFIGIAFDIPVGINAFFISFVVFSIFTIICLIFLGILNCRRQEENYI